MAITITIPGKPIAKKRPKFARRGKFVTTYNPQESEEGRWITLAHQYFPEKPFEGPIVMNAEFHMPIPKSVSKKRREMMILGEIMHTKKPDTDNMLKFAKDCLNGFAWVDDSQVIECHCRKLYSDTPKTILNIQQVTDAH
jgi:Holliday junction resolvase RusA-like endonuclease